MNPASPTAWEIAEGVLRRWWVLVAGFVAGAVIAVGVTFVQPAGYVASTAVLVQLPAQDSADTEAVIRTVQSLLASDVLMQDVARASESGVSARTVARELSTSRASGSAVINVDVRDDDRERAVAVADAVLPSLESRLVRAQIADRSADGTRVSRSIQVDTLGLATAEPVGRPLARNGVLGAAGGLGLALLAAIGLTVAAVRRDQRTGDPR